MWPEFPLKNSATMLGWFYNYNSGSNALINAEGIEEYDWHVCLNDGNRLFAAFRTLDGMYEYVQAARTKCFYEIISGTLSQKMYFDIDMSGSSEENKKTCLEVVSKTITAITESLSVYEVKPELLVFSSCGERKQSYHIIVSNLCVKSSKHNRSFAEQVRNAIPPEYRKFVDILYKSCQQFRLMNSTKFGEVRYKRYDPKLSTVKLQDDKEIFKLSLVGNTEGLTVVNIPLFERDDFPARMNVEVPEISRRLRIKEITGFEYAKTVNNIVCLRRLKPTFCTLCRRTHDSENAFVIVGDLIKFFCRRNTENDFIDLGVSKEKFKAMDAFEALGVM